MSFKDDRLAWLQDIEDNYVTPVVNKYNALISNIGDSPLGQVFLESSDGLWLTESRDNLLSKLEKARQLLENISFEVSRDDERFASFYSMIDQSNVRGETEEAENKLNEFIAQLDGLS